jgi:hypothetical protein
MIDYVLSLKGKYDFEKDLMTEAGRPEKNNHPNDFMYYGYFCVTTKGNRNSLGGLDVERILARFPEGSLSALVPIQPRTQGILGLISLGVKRPPRS